MLAAINSAGACLLSVKTAGPANCQAETEKADQELLYLKKKDPRRSGKRVDARKLAAWRSQVNAGARSLGDRVANCRQLTTAQKDSLLTRAVLSMVIALGNEHKTRERLAMLNDLIYVAGKMVETGVPRETVIWALQTADLMVDCLSGKILDSATYRGQISRLRRRVN